VVTDRDVRSRDAYLFKSVVHSSRLLTAFRSPGEALALREIASGAASRKTRLFGCCTTWRNAAWSKRWARTTVNPVFGPGDKNSIDSDTPRREPTINSRVKYPAVSASGNCRRNRTHFARQPLQLEDRVAQCRPAGARKSGLGHRISNRPRRHSDCRGEVSRSGDSLDRNGYFRIRALRTTEPTTTRLA
jgi:hypothetical protein